MAKKSFKIIYGPSKFDLMMALFDNTATAPRQVSFQPESGMEALSIHLLSIGREDGSGESWLLEGIVFWPDRLSDRKVRGYFSTQRRTGYLNIMDK
ncbi:MAG: SH3 domain-containing protein [Minisyncoccota bacterium]